MRSVQQSRRSVLHVTAVLTRAAYACGGAQVEGTVDRSSPIADVETVVTLENPPSTLAADASRSLESTLVAALTFEDSINGASLVIVAQIISVGDVVAVRDASAKPNYIVEDGAGVSRKQYDFQVLTVAVIDVLKDDGTGTDTPRSGDLLAVALPNRTDSPFVPERVGPVGTVGLRILITGALRVVGFENGFPKRMLLARPNSSYVELPSSAGEPTRGVRLWTAYSDRRTLASRGGLTEAVLDAMEYADAPLFADLLARVLEADTLPREQHLGYDQVTRTTLPQPPPGNEP